MTTRYEVCTGWVDVHSCNPDTDYRSKVQNESSCHELINGDRQGYCICHNGALPINRRCGHKQMRCHDVCTTATMGCNDAATQFAVSFSDGHIVGCNGAWEWNESGLNAVSENLCDNENGFHICSDHDQADYLGLTKTKCGQRAEPNTFYLTNLVKEHRIFGCGDDEQYDKLPVEKTLRNGFSKPFALSLSEWKLDDTSYEDGPWKLRARHPNEKPLGDMRDRLYKTEVSGGGVMCCKHKKKKKGAQAIPHENTGEGPGMVILMILTVLTLLGVVTYLVWEVPEMFKEWKADNEARRRRELAMNRGQVVAIMLEQDVLP